RNKQLALQILRARVEKLESEAASETQRRLKSDQIGSGSRSGRIRTYNFVRSFVVDHRTGRKTPRLDQVMKGRFDLLM
ncbi:MAG TPA: peptide chain release factor-like protein, partial [Candidatus Melainabacteria bacterium]|nr:peptide chain release factor-like protein [Candidatus Melainabacteria bacterium]